MDDFTPDMPDETQTDGLSPDELQTMLKRLRTEHRAIDNELKAISETGVTDMLKMRRMKKVKLAMKDRISFLENQITPDIIA